jgi:hypothetical protein
LVNFQVKCTCKEALNRIQMKKTGISKPRKPSASPIPRIRREKHCPTKIVIKFTTEAALFWTKAEGKTHLISNLVIIYMNFLYFNLFCQSSILLEYLDKQSKKRKENQQHKTTISMECIKEPCHVQNVILFPYFSILLVLIYFSLQCIF